MSDLLFGKINRTSTVGLFGLFLALYSVYSFGLPAVEDHLVYAPIPSWVRDISVEHSEHTPEAQITSGTFYLLVDRQVRVPERGKQEAFYHYATQIVNQSGLEREAQINIEFDPAYQSVVLHRVQLWRDGRKIDQMGQAKLSLLQREKNLKRLLYDGRLSANIILPDVRVGDIVEYSYTRQGTNPVYGGTFALRLDTQWAIPVGHLHLRLLWERDEPLAVRALNGAKEPQVRDYPAGREYLFEENNVQPLLTSSQTPEWYDPYGQLIMTNSESWSDVVDWALPLYRSAVQVDADIQAIATGILSSHQTRETQIYAALAFVQSEVRYLGLEMGEGSHKPSPATETLARRYGDCKDKAVLLISLLDALGIEAHPALVNTVREHKVADYPAMVSAFDHVIVHFRHEEKDWWVDPTRQHQRGTLHTLAQSAYGYALVVKSGIAELTKMEVVPSGKIVIQDEFDLSGGPEAAARYETTTRYDGFEAEQQYQSFSRNSSGETAQQYLNFYKKRYPTIAATSALNVAESPDGGTLVVAEQYEITDVWGNDSGNSVFSVGAHAVSDALRDVEERERNAPFALQHPHHVIQKITVALHQNNWSFSEEPFVEENRFFTYRSNVLFDPATNALNLDYEYTSHTDHVPMEYIDEYIQAVKSVEDHTGYTVYYGASSGANTDDSNDSPFDWFALVAALYIAASVYIFYSLSRDTKRRQANTVSVFYPMSLVKLCILSMASFGVYSCYWFYKSWRAIEHQDKANIWPWARTIFSALWFYPLAARIATGKEEKRQQFLPKSPMVLAVLALIYLAAVMIQNVETYHSWIALAVGTALVVALVHQTNLVKQEDELAYAAHSRWKMRHWILILLCLPIWFLTIGYEANLLPSPDVVPGSAIAGHDAKFMQRNGIIKPGEDIIYFYSDAFWDLRADGNGLTNEGVFSYWKDEAKQVITEVAAFGDIAHFEMQDAGAWSEDAVISIVRKDGTDFVLYVSTEKNGHTAFYAELERLWAGARDQADSDKTFNKAAETEDERI